jgi:solute carrier family 25 protein 16
MPERITLHNEAENTKATNITRNSSAQMTTEYVPRLAGREPTICPTDDNAILPRKQHKLYRDSGEILDKQSWEYIIKSGVAGGLAGCAVCDLYQYMILRVC